MGKFFDFLKKHWFGIGIFGVAILASGALFNQSRELGTLALLGVIGGWYFFDKLSDFGRLIGWLDEDSKK